VSGRRVATVLNARLQAGPHESRWSGRDDRGDAVASGLYFLRLEAHGYDLTRRVPLLP